MSNTTQAETQWFITRKETHEDGNSNSVTMGFVEFMEKVHEVSFNDWIKVNHNVHAQNGRKYKAVADKEPFTITLHPPSKGEKQRDIDFKLDTREHDITVIAIDGLKVNKLDKVVFSGEKEKVSFEYNYSTNSWILW